MLSAKSTVQTEKASRYLKALCNHFDRKVTAEYDDNQGNVDFGWGLCQMIADEKSLSFSIQAENEENFGRVKYVVADHLERFSGEDALKVEWVEVSTETE